MTETVEFRPIPGFWRYLAGSDGRIYTRTKAGKHRDVLRDRPKPLVGTVPKNPHRSALYRVCTLVDDEDKMRRRLKIHALICTAWHGPRPPGKIARHLDDDRGNNRPSNLAWGTFGDNAADRNRNGNKYRPERNPPAPTS